MSVVVRQDTVFLYSCYNFSKANKKHIHQNTQQVYIGMSSQHSCEQKIYSDLDLQGPAKFGKITLISQCLRILYFYMENTTLRI